MLKPIDIHTHLSSEGFEADRSEVLQRAIQACEYLIDIGAGTGERAHLAARDLADQFGSVYFTAGIHPHDAGTHGANSQIKKEIEELLSHPKCVAVGECGLDYYYDHSPREIQKEVFTWQMELARKFNLPLMIHTRDAEEDTMEMLSNFEGHAVFHCFTGSQKLADFGVRKGFRISFSGIVTFKNAQDLRQVFRSLPQDRILIETDSPYLAPVPMRGKRNESAFIEHTAEFLAKELGISVEDFLTVTRANSLDSFPRLETSPNIKAI
jgi:TatD DNase family protein